MGLKSRKTLGGSSDGIKGPKTLGGFKGQKIIGGSSGGFNGHK